MPMREYGANPTHPARKARFQAQAQSRGKDGFNSHVKKPTQFFSEAVDSAIRPP